MKVIQLETLQPNNFQKNNFWILHLFINNTLHKLLVLCHLKVHKAEIFKYRVEIKGQGINCTF